MKNLLEYINETLRPEVKKWITNIYDKMLSLEKEGKLTELNVDIKKLAKPEKGGFEYEDFFNDTTVKNFVNNNVFGFTVINQMTKQYKKYMISEGDIEEELKPECLPYWYQGESNVYFVGLVMFDINVVNIEEYANLVAIETSLCIKDSLPLYKAMLTDFSLHYLDKKGKFKGLSSKPIHPKMKAILQKLGFKPYSENKEILIYDI